MNGVLVRKEKEIIKRVQSHLVKRELLRGEGKGEVVNWVMEVLDRNVYKWMLAMERAAHLIWSADLRQAVLGDKHLWVIGERPEIIDRHLSLGLTTLGRQDMWFYLAVSGSHVPAQERGVLV